MKRTSLTIARRYARALFEVARAQGDVPATVTGLGGALQLFETIPELRRTLMHPGIPAERKRRVAAAVWQRDVPLVVRLLDLLVTRNRLALLPAIHAALCEIWNEQRGVVSARAVSAIPLEADQQQGLRTAAGRLVGGEVELTTAVDPGLLGGLLLHIRGRTYDGSVRARLRRLRTRLAAAAARATTSSPSPSPSP